MSKLDGLSVVYLRKKLKLWGTIIKENLSFYLKKLLNECFFVYFNINLGSLRYVCITFSYQLTNFSNEPNVYSSALCQIKGYLLYYKVPPLSPTRQPVELGQPAVGSLACHQPQQTWSQWPRRGVGQRGRQLLWRCCLRQYFVLAKCETQESVTQIGFLFKQNHPKKFPTHLGQNGPAKLRSKVPCTKGKAGTSTHDHELHDRMLVASFLYS